MNLFELQGSIDLEDKASGKLKNIGSLLGKGLATAAKVGGAAIGVAATGIATLTKTAVQNFAEYEQLVGGAELMFGKAFETVKKNAQDAYKTVQMSQNEYLQQVNGFATGLKTALGGNEQAAAELSHRIIKAEADIIAATGNAAENVKNAFNGIMKSNFTMLDNLQIGITPTKEGFQEVIDKVNAWNKANGNATKYQMGNLADMQSALVDYIDMVGMSEYAQNEAAKTISGSLASMKAAFNNLVTGVADDSANFGQLIDNMVDSAGAFASNVIPRIEVALNGIVKLIGKLAPIVVQEIPKLADAIVPALIDAAMNLVKAVTDVLPSLLETASDVLLKNAPLLINALVDLIRKLVDSLGDEKNLETITKGAVDILMTLLDGFIDLFPQVIAVGTKILISLVEGLAEALPEAIPMIVDAGIALIDGLIKVFLETDWGEIGGKIATGLWEGIKSGWKSLKIWFENQWEGFKAYLAGEEYTPKELTTKKVTTGKISGGGGSLLDKMISKDLGTASARNEKLAAKAIETAEKFANAAEKIEEETTITIINTAKMSADELEKIEKERLDRQKNLREEFLGFVEDTTDKMIALEEEYQDKLAERIETIQNSYDIFEEVAEREKVNYIELLNNLAMQNANVERFYGNIEKLRARGVGEDLINELLGKGVSAIDELDAILGMSDEFLAEYEAMYEKRAEIAEKYANIQLADEKSALEKNLETMFDSIGATYDANAEELGVSFIENFIEKIKEGTANIAIALKTTISDAFAQVMGTGSLLNTASGGGIANSIASALVGALGGNAESGGFGIYLDGNLLVGGIVDRTNGALGDSYALDERGAIA